MQLFSFKRRHELKSSLSAFAPLAIAAFFCAAFAFCGPGFAQDEEQAGGSLTIDGKDVGYSEIEGANYVSLGALSKKLGLSVKFFPESNMYRVKSAGGREFKFVLNKRSAVADDKYYKSGDPIIKVGEDVKIPVDIVTGLYGVSAPAGKKAAPAEATKKEEPAKKEETAKNKQEPAPDEFDEIVVGEDSPDETEDVHIVVENEPRQAATAEVSTAQQPAAVKTAENVPAASSTAEVVSAASETSRETSEVEKPSVPVIENVKYRRAPDSFELDVAFDRTPPVDGIRTSLNPDKTLVDIQIGKVDSKLNEQMIKITENIVSNVKLTIVPGAGKNNNAILSMSSAAAVNVSTRVSGNTVTFILNRKESSVAPLISEEPGSSTTSVGLAPVTAPVDATSAVQAKQPPPAEDPKSKVPVVANIKNPESIIAGIENLNCVIAVDAGHGGEEFGVISESRASEKDIALDISRRLKSIIDKTKLRGVLVRSGDYFMPVDNRLKAVNSYDTKVFVGVHLGSSTSPGASGVGVFYYDLGMTDDSASEAASAKTDKPADVASANIEAQANEILKSMNASKRISDSKLLADKVTEAMKRQKNFKVRKVRGTRVAGLSELMMPGIVVEAGFLSNRDDEKALQTAEYKDQIALAIFEGIKEYLMVTGGR